MALPALENEIKLNKEYEALQKGQPDSAWWFITSTLVTHEAPCLPACGSFFIVRRCPLGTALLASSPHPPRLPCGWQHYSRLFLVLGGPAISWSHAV